MSVVTYSGNGAELPALETFTRLPLVALFCTSRSGVTLVQAMLDGHPEVLQIPTQLKLYDFFDAHSLTDAATSVRQFVEFPKHDHLFDTGLSGDMHKDRLGEHRDVRVIVDRIAFETAAVTLLGSGSITPRDFVAATVAAYNWCLGRDLRAGKVILAHIHHGDWLFPRELVDTYNLWPMPKRDGVDILKPDKAVISVRNPVETLESLEQYAANHENTPEARETAHRRFTYLYIQDVLRHASCEAAGIPVLPVKLEEMRRSTERTMNGLAEWLGIEPGRPEAMLPTAYGLPWHGDPATAPSAKPKPQPPIKTLSPSDPDHALVMLAAGGQLMELGYATPGSKVRAFATMLLGRRRRRFWTVAGSGAGVRWRFLKAVRRRAR